MDNVLVKKLYIAPAQCSPEIIFDHESSRLEIKGESYPENTTAFYEPILRWVENHLAHTEHPQTMAFNLEMLYFNSGTSKSFHDLFHLLDQAVQQGREIVVNWIYDKENENALTYGQEFQEDLQWLEFNLVEKATA